MNSLTGTISSIFGVTGTKTTGASTSQDPLALQTDTTFSYGTAAGNANQSWSRRQTPAALAVDTYDIAGGIADAFGDTLTFTRIKGFYFKNTGTTNLTLSGTVGFLGGGTITVRPDGVVQIAAPDATAYAVTNGASDSLVVTNTSGSTAGAYDLAIVGTV